jgi:hypothetical protein
MRAAWYSSQWCRAAAGRPTRKYSLDSCPSALQSDLFSFIASRYSMEAMSCRPANSICRAVSLLSFGFFLICRPTILLVRLVRSEYSARFAASWYSPFSDNLAMSGRMVLSGHCQAIVGPLFGPRRPISLMISSTTPSLIGAWLGLCQSLGASAVPLLSFGLFPPFSRA